MQTFLPYADFAASAAVLDERRLGKQRVEALQVLRALTRTPYGWKNHPAVLMWAGAEEALVRYGLDVCAVWTARGRNDTVAATLARDAEEALGLVTARTQAQLAAAGDVPAWLGDERVHLSHRSRLIQKDPGFYRPHFPGTPEDLECFWPVRRSTS
ncbi:MAG TPA: MSMEG_6728 family protein [Mycobacteriales bacterium]|nr:MSMEG_6728 family protein [Mycobacteriales bacterium]